MLQTLDHLVLWDRHTSSQLVLGEQKAPNVSYTPGQTMSTRSCAGTSCMTHHRKRVSGTVKMHHCKRVSGTVKITHGGTETSFAIARSEQPRAAGFLPDLWCTGKKSREMKRNPSKSIPLMSAWASPARATSFKTSLCGIQKSRP